MMRNINIFDMSDCTIGLSDEEMRVAYVLAQFDRWVFVLIGPIVFIFLLGVILMFLTK